MFDLQGIYSLYWWVFVEIVLPLLVAVLNFYIKCKNMFISAMERARAFFDENFDPEGICRFYWRLFAKIVLLPLLATILNFCVKRKNVFILETERARAISMKFLCKTKKCVYL